MTPKDYIVNALHAALDNAHDMRMASEWGSVAGDEISAEQYALSVIVENICAGAVSEVPDCGYLHVQYDDNDTAFWFTKEELRPFLTEAIVEFLSSL